MWQILLWRSNRKTLFTTQEWGYDRDESVKLFSERGYNATAIRQIASAAGVNEATIYIYFDNKEALMDEILQVF